MFTAIITHQACLGHETPLGHPECADRLRAVLRALDGEEFAYLPRIEAPRASEEQLIRVHPPGFVRDILAAVPTDGHHHIDADTSLSPGSGEAALRAAGAVVHAVDLVMAGDMRTAFCAVRPPGHHAEPDAAMGFCLFNNVAVGARHAQAKHGAKRVAMIDFDVHHGNGNQAVAFNDPTLFYGSTHQYPLYPGTGAPAEKGVAGNIVNAILPEGAGSEAFRGAYLQTLLPAIEAFKPDLIMISAGFDAHENDPLAGLNLTDEDYLWVTRQLVALAERVCQGRVVSALEGGYNLRALARSTREHVRGLMGF